MIYQEQLVNWVVVAWRQGGIVTRTGLKQAVIIGQ